MLAKCMVGKCKFMLPKCTLAKQMLPQCNFAKCVLAK
jgi:hypothetical protein